MTGFHDIEALVAAHQKISAIKEFRARTGVGLAHRSSREGYLVLLRDRACFVHADRRFGVEPDIAYDMAHHVEVGYGSPAVLFVSVGHVHERFELAKADAEAALALFRVFSP